MASGICDKLALGTKLTEAEEAQIQSDKEFMQSMGNLYESTGTQHAAALATAYDTNEQTVRLAAQGIGAVFGLIGTFGGATAEEDKKTKKFRTCMEEMDWEMKGDEDE